MTMICISTGPHSWFAHRADAPSPRLYPGWGISGEFSICVDDTCPGGADCPPSHRQPHLDALRSMMATINCPPEIIDATAARSAARPSVKAGGGCCGGSCRAMPVELIDLRPQRPGGKYGAAPEPTPEEIRQRCAEIQAEWTPAEERSRRVVHNPRPVVPEVRTDGEGSLNSD